MKKQLKKDGITLISLVITVILLLILASVAISLAVNADGLFPRAEYAKDEWNKKVAEEETEVGGLLGKLEEMVPGDKKPDEPPSEPTAVYAKLYTDGTLILSSTDYEDPDRDLEESYGDISEKEYYINKDNDKLEGEYPGWLEEEYFEDDDYYDYTNKAKSIIIYDKIVPKNILYWFYYFEGIELNLTNLDTSNVTDMSLMFFGCQGLNSLDLSQLDTSNVTDMNSMFLMCSNLESLDLSQLDTSSVTNMFGMFCNCSSLGNLDLSSFDTSSVTDMSYMFQGCSSLESLDLSSFDTSSVTNVDRMFNDCTATVYVKDQAAKNLFESDSFSKGATFIIKEA